MFYINEVSKVLYCRGCWWVNLKVKVPVEDLDELEDNIKICVTGTEWQGLDGVYLTQGRDMLRVLVNTVIGLR